MTDSQCIQHLSKFSMRKAQIYFIIIVCCLFVVPQKSLSNPLIKAVGKGDFVKVKSLLAEGMPVDSTDFTKSTALMEASSKGDINIGKYLLEQGANVNAQDFALFTPLYYAAYENNVAMVRLLLENGAKVDSRSDKGATALINYPHYDTMKILLEYGADINAYDDAKMTPLISTALYGDSKTMKLLLANGANVNALSNEFGSALMALAIRAHADEKAKILIEAGADFNLKTPEGYTALMKAAISSNAKLIKFLLDQGANANSVLDVEQKIYMRVSGKTEEFILPVGSTALMIAVCAADIASIKEFLHYKSTDINIANALGETALSYAIKHHRKEIVALLKNAGAKGKAKPQT